MLQFACGFGELECAEALVEAKADIEAMDNNNNTALHYAAGYGQEESTKLLLKQCASLVQAERYLSLPKRDLSCSDLAGWALVYHAIPYTALPMDSVLQLTCCAQIEHCGLRPA